MTEAEASLFTHETFEPTRPRWVIEYPPHWDPERRKELDAAAEAIERGDAVVLLPDGAYLRSTDPIPFLGPTTALEPLSVPWWPNLLSVVALLLATVALVLVLVR